MDKGYICFKDKYKGIIILTGEEKRDEKTRRALVEVQCPCCKNKRYIRKTFLSDNNKQKIQSSLCSSCNSKTERVFDKDDIGYYTIVNEKKVYLDEEDLNRCKELNLQIDNTNHVTINLKSKTLAFHRFIMGIEDNKLQIDHINHNPLDNRKINLRVCTASENAKNIGITPLNNTGFKNISMCDREKKWFVQFKENDIRTTKRFKDFKEAFKYLKDNKIKTNYDYNIFEDNTISLKYAGYYKDDFANGEGIGSVLFVQTCSHKCLGCHNKETWDAEGGALFTEEVFNKMMEDLAKNHIKRLTLSGGDPFDNLLVSNYVASEFKYRYPEKELWIYTGYTMEELKKRKEFLPLLECADVLVDGPFIEEEKDLTLKFRGSKNQKIWRKNNDEWIEIN